MAGSSALDWSALIPEAPFDWEMIPLDGHKRPIDPATGNLMKDWPLHPGYDIEDISKLNGLVKAVGLKLGPPSGGVLAVDFDGPEAVGTFTEIYSRDPGDLPNTIGVTSGKKKRGQRFFLVDQDWWPALCGRKVWTGQDGSICFELRWAGHQSVIAGAHPETNGYTWLPNSSPADIEMALAPDWLLEPLVHQEQDLPPVEITAQDSQRAINMLRFIDPQQRTSYDAWLSVGMALHNTDPGLLNAWIDWARPMPNFDEDEHFHKWQSFGKSSRTNGLTIRSLHHWAKDGGYKEPKKSGDTAISATPEQICQAQTLDDLLGPVQNNKLRRPRTDILTTALAMVLPLKFNALTQRIENDGHPIDGDFLGTLYLQLAERYSLEVAPKRAADAAMLVARRNSYHPVRDYLSSLNKTLDPHQWDQLASLCLGINDRIATVHLQRQLIGLVARAMTPGCKLDTALVIHSPKQGIGKSTMWSILGGQWFSDSLGDLRNLKDDVLQLHSAWIHEWGEIDSVVGKRESETLKKFLSATKDDVRKPYGRGVETLVRSCGIVGTTNRSDFIKDPTGNRRFPVISVDTVNNDWVAAHRDAIWGSALHAFNSGARWHYDSAENQAISKVAQDFAAEDPLRDQIETWIDDNPAALAVAMPVIVYHLNPERLRDPEFARQVSIRLTALGWTKSPKRERGYLPNGDRHDKATVWMAPS